MKKTLLVASALLFAAASSSYAQYSNVAVQSSPTAKPFRSAKTTGSNLRLLKCVVDHYRDTGYVLDSLLIYSYSGNRVWDAILNNWKYDIVNQTLYNLPASAHRQPIRKMRIYDQNENLVQEDNQWYDSATASWQTTYRDQYVYANGKLAEHTHLIPANPVYDIKTQYKYDGSGNLLEETDLQWNISSSVWDSTGRTKYTYTPDGISEVLELQWKNHAWKEDSKSSFTYTNGKQTLITFQFMDTNNWKNLYKVSITYNTNGEIAERTSISWNVFANSWDTNSRIIYEYNSTGDSIAMINQGYNNSSGWLTYTKDIKVYNSDGLINTEYSIMWDRDNMQWIPAPSYPRHQYYYGLFNLNVTEQKNNSVNLSLFPVPATNNLTVSTGFKNAASFQAAIRSADGRLVRAWSQPVVGNSYNESINVSDLPAGNYVFTISSDEGISSKQFNIVR